jgi:hypothetical protein
MSRRRSLRRSLAALLVAGVATGGLALAAAPAGANVRPGITVTHYQLTPTESYNVCGGSNAILRFVETYATYVVNCGTGDVTIYS